MPRQKQKRKNGKPKQQKTQNQISQLQAQIRKLKEENNDLNRQIDFGHHFATSSAVPALEETCKTLTVEAIEADDEKTQSPTHQSEETKESTVIATQSDESRTIFFQNRIALLERCKTLDHQRAKLVVSENALRDMEADLEMARNELNVSIQGAEKTFAAERQKHNGNVRKLTAERNTFEENKMKFAIGVSTICAALGCAGYAVSR